MEFQGQRGDPYSAWSVGKYAKRSATIHLCSEDFQSQETNVLSATIASYDPDLNNRGQVSVFDPPAAGPGVVNPNPFRAAIGNLQEGFVRIHNPAMGMTYQTSTLSLGGNANDG